MPGSSRGPVGQRKKSSGSEQRQINKDEQIAREIQASGGIRFRSTEEDELDDSSESEDEQGLGGSDNDGGAAGGIMNVV